MNLARTIVESLLSALVLAILVAWWRDSAAMSRREAAFRAQLGRRLVVRLNDTAGGLGTPPLLDLSLSSVIALTELAPGVPIFSTSVWAMELSPAHSGDWGGYAVGRAGVGASPARPVRPASPRGPR